MSNASALHCGFCVSCCCQCRLLRWGSSTAANLAAADVATAEVQLPEGCPPTQPRLLRWGTSTAADLAAAEAAHNQTLEPNAVDEIDAQHSTEGHLKELSSQDVFEQEGTQHAAAAAAAAAAERPIARALW